MEWNEKLQMIIDYVEDHLQRLFCFSMDTADPKGIFGLFGAYDGRLHEVEYSIMAISDEEPPQGFTAVNIPDATWAVFDCRGSVPRAIQKGWQYLHKEYLPLLSNIRGIWTIGLFWKKSKM